MREVGDDKDGQYAQARVPGRIYVSRRFPYKGAGEGDPLLGRAARFSYTVLDNTSQTEFSSDGGFELVLRTTPTRQQLKAMFFEDPRGIKAITFQRFTGDDRHMRKESFTLYDEEVGQLAAFLALMQSEGLTFTGEDGMRFAPELTRQLIGGSDVLAEIVRKDPELLETIIRSDVSAPDVVALARRREVLREFSNLLYDEENFAAASREAKGPERAWQRFLEANQWIIGGGVGPQFLHSYDSSRLEQTVRGTSIAGPGKRPDAVLRTAGAISALVLAEVKHHQTPLLGNKYRPECWRVSDEVIGGVAQCQAAVDMAEHDLAPLVEVRDADGNPIAQVAVCRPRSVLIVGSLEEFHRGDRINRPKYESFERLRRSLRDPEIITFDELYERARLILDLASDGEGSNEGSGGDLA